MATYTYTIPIKSSITGNIYNIVAQQFGPSNNKYKILIVNGGPGANYNYMIPPFLDLLSQGITLFFYFQLGVNPSSAPPVYNINNQPNPDYSIEYYASELEQIRRYFNITWQYNFILGHSFGTCIIFQWAKDYPLSLKSLCGGLILSSSVVSVPRYIEYTNKILGTYPPNIQQILMDPTNPLYEQTANIFYNYRYLIRIQPYPPAFQNTLDTLNTDLYNYLQGPSEFIINGTLTTFDLMDTLSKINIPCLVIGGIWDTVDPNLQRETAFRLKDSVYYLTSGSHNCFWDDPINYFRTLLHFITKE